LPREDLDAAGLIGARSGQSTLPVITCRRERRLPRAGVCALARLASGEARI